MIDIKKYIDEICSYFHNKEWKVEFELYVLTLYKIYVRPSQKKHYSPFSIPTQKEAFFKIFQALLDPRKSAHEVREYRREKLIISLDSTDQYLAIFGKLWKSYLQEKQKFQNHQIHSYPRVRFFFEKIF